MGLFFFASVERFVTSCRAFADYSQWQEYSSSVEAFFGLAEKSATIAALTNMFTAA